VFGGPSSLALVVPLTDRWALRPDAALTRTTFKVGGATSRITVEGVGISLLFTRTRREALETYVAQRAAISRTVYDDASHADTWIFDTLYGASYALGARVRVFGEGGVRVSSVRPPSSGGDNSSTSIALRSHLGLTLRL
jgi:hypothetical protein